MGLGSSSFSPTSMLTAVNRGFSRATYTVRIRDITQLTPGDHVQTRGRLNAYWHHQIVIEVNPENQEIVIVGYAKGLKGNGAGKYSITKETVTWDFVKEDIEKCNYYKDNHKRRKFTELSPEETVKKAIEAVGKSGITEGDKYNLVGNNCEHFATWCKTGVAFSEQPSDFGDGLVDAVDQAFGKSPIPTMAAGNFISMVRRGNSDAGLAIWPAPPEQEED